jgi:glycogen debranching enzyme
MNPVGRLGPSEPMQPSPRPRSPKHRPAFKTMAVAMISLASLIGSAEEQALELSRTDRPWEFLAAVGTRAGLFGDESGKIEAWVYPLKLFRNFHLQFEVEGRVIPAEALARTVTARPESSTIRLAGDTFAVEETFFVPVQEAGAIVLFQIDSAQPLNVRVSFERDFQLEWPAALGATYANWDSKLRAFSFGEEQKTFVALIGSPTATNEHLEYQTNYAASNEESFDLGATAHRIETRVVVISASVHGAAEAEATYQQLSSNYSKLMSESVAYYRAYLERTVSLELPDAQLQKAYDWSRISMLEGLVNNPFLGTSLIAGYRTSGAGQRPGFAWFFGRDALWTSLALNAEGDFSTTRSALDFLSKFQREDGKIPHEIAQTANFVDWFKNYPYGYASADATPLYIIGVNDYVSQSGDVAFAREKWQSVWKAYQFLRSTYDAQGLPQNLGIGHGWVEGGPLLPVKSELYQCGVGAAALRALASLARLTDKTDMGRELSQESSRLEQLINQVFWLPQKKRYAYALDRAGKPMDEPSVLATVPMWFGLLREEQAQSMISELATPEHEADWGMRIISSQAANYSGGGYHYGSVWPLFTGWASVGEYQYHRALPAYTNLRSNALLALDGSLGHVTEVLSGDYYQPLSTSSPHQIWSAAMVVSPLLRGLFGLSADTSAHVLTFAPHVPADWTSFAISNVHVGACTLNLRYHRTEEDITLDAERSGSGDCALEFSPAISFAAEVMSVEMNGHLLQHRVLKSAVDQHVSMRFPLAHGSNKVHISIRNDFGLSLTSTLPALGAASCGLRVVSETWSTAKDRLELEVAGISGSVYELGIWNAKGLKSVDGAEWIRGADPGKLRIHIPASGSQGYARERIVFHFTEKRAAEHAKGTDN